MADQDNPVRLDGDEARGGETTGVMRYVLGLSLLLVIAAFAIIYWSRRG